MIKPIHFTCFAFLLTWAGLFSFCPAQSPPFTATQNTSDSKPQLLLGPFSYLDSSGQQDYLNLVNSTTNAILAADSSQVTCQNASNPWQCGLYMPLSRIGTTGFAVFQRERPSGYELLIFDNDLNLVDSLNGSIGVLDNHEGRIWNHKVYSIFSDFTTEPGVEHMGVQVQDSATKNLLWSWGTYPIDSTCYDPQFNQGNGNRYHCNSVWPFEWGGDEWILMSARNIGSLILINTVDSTHWLIGGTCSDFSVDVRFSGQHDAQVVEVVQNGLVISLFNNALHRGYSSGSTYVLDTANQTFTLQSEVIHPDSIQGSFMGSFQKFSWGSVVGWGGSVNLSIPNPAVNVFDTSGAIIWELTYPNPNVFSYRAVTGAVDFPLVLTEEDLTSEAVDYYYLFGPLSGRKAEFPLPKNTLLVKMQRDGKYLGKVFIQ